MKKLILWATSIIASLCAFFTINGTFSAHASSNGKDVSALDLGVKLKETVFTYTGGVIQPEYMLTNGETGWTNEEYQSENYTIGYRYNINAGTGSIVAVGKGEYSGQTTLATFTILPLDIKEIPNLTVNVGVAEYTGKPTFPCVDIAVGFRTLRESVDYTITADNNTNIGYSTGKITFKGNYTGSRSIFFKIGYAPINHFTARQETAGNVLRWDSVDCDKINVYRQDDQNGASTLIGTASGNEFIDTTAPQLSNCHYIVQSQTTYNGKLYTTSSQSRTVTTTLNAPKVDLTSNGSSVTLSWNSNPNAEGYLVYVDGMIAADLRESGSTTYTITDVVPTDKHKFSVSAFGRYDGQLIYSPQSEEIDSYQKPQEQSVLRNAKKTDQLSFTITDSQKQTNSLYAAVTLSNDDIAILSKFAKEHFTDDMTDSDKLRYTLNWINRNTNYAQSQSDWNKIAKSSYVDAIFNKKTGQCAQYNGAMVSMMRYLGYEANMVLGWRGTWPSNYWQHFWGEIEIDGTKYMIEVGNYGKSGSWSYFLAPYNRTDGKYIINCKNMQASGGWYYY